MKAHEFDQKFDAGEDVSDLFDWSKARRRNAQTKRVDADSPSPMVSGLGQRAKQSDVAHHSIIKQRDSDRLE